MTETAIVRLLSPHCTWSSAHPPHGSLQGLSSHQHPARSLHHVILTWCKSLLLLAVEVTVGRDHRRNNGDLEERQSTVNLQISTFLPQKEIEVLQ